MAEEKNGWTIQSISLLLVAGGLAVGLWQYWDANRQQYKMEIWSAQKELYESAIEAASRIANADSLESVVESRKQFWELYWGNLAMLESPRVADAMVDFGKILAKCEESMDGSCFQPTQGNLPNPLQKAAIGLARCARESLQDTWEPVDIGELAGKCPQ